jgi:hypothetical protein
MDDRPPLGEEPQNGKPKKRDLSVMMSIALEDGVETTADAIAAKEPAERGELTCAGSSCGRGVYFVRKHVARATEFPNHFKILPSSKGHTGDCDIWKKMGLLERKAHASANRVPADGTSADGVSPQRFAINPLAYKVVWGDGRLPEIRPAEPHANVGEPETDPSGRRSRAGGAGTRRKRMRSAQDVENERQRISRSRDPKAESLRISVLLDESESDVPWPSFFVNWHLTMKFADLTRQVASAEIVHGVAFATTVREKPIWRFGEWYVKCSERQGGAGRYALWAVFPHEPTEDLLVRGACYIVAGPRLSYELKTGATGVTFHNLHVHVLGPRWVAKSGAPTNDRAALAILASRRRSSATRTASL